MFQKESSGMLQVMKWRFLSSLSSSAVTVQGQYNVSLWILKIILCYFDPEPLKKKETQKTKTNRPQTKE